MDSDLVGPIVQMALGPWPAPHKRRHSEIASAQRPSLSCGPADTCVGSDCAPHQLGQTQGQPQDQPQDQAQDRHEAQQQDLEHGKVHGREEDGGESRQDDSCENKDGEEGREADASEEDEEEDGEEDGEDGQKHEKRHEHQHQPQHPQQQQQQQRARRSRSKAAVQAAQERARVLSESVKTGTCMPPKRNRPFEMTHPAKLGMVQLGPFWYSPDPKSPFYLSYEAYGVLTRILPFYQDPKNLLKFHKARSVANLRFFLNFHILHCKTSQVLACDQQDTFMVDFSNEYRAMQRRYTRDWFDEFNRGPSVLLFDAPPEILQAHQEEKGAVLENPPLDDLESLRHMLCVAPRQLNYFHWIFVTGKYEVMCAREPKLHPTLNEFVKGHRERKSRMQLRTRQKLCTGARGPVVVDRPAKFTMCL